MIRPILEFLLALFASIGAMMLIFALAFSLAYLWGLYDEYKDSKKRKRRF